MKKSLSILGLLAIALIAYLVGLDHGSNPNSEGVALAHAANAAPVAAVAPSRASSRHSVVVDIAQKVSPAIVTIGTTMMVRGRTQLNVFDSDFFNFFVPGPSKEGYFPYMGSGFLVDEEDVLGTKPASNNPTRTFVLTNYHVIQQAEKIFVTLTDGREFPAKLLDADAVVDVALLELAVEGDKNIPTVKLGDSDAIMVGEGVVALGNPFGPIIEDPQPTVTVGVVSAVNRSFQPEVDPNSGNPRVYQNMIQTDASINPGNSGGPLVNMDGEVIGINTFIIAPGTSSSAGVNFSTPINRAIRVGQEILQYGKVRSLYVDMNVYPVSAKLAQRYDLKETQGLLIVSMDKTGPGARAGLQAGDIVLKVNGKDILNADQFYAAFYSRTVGETIKFSISRDGARSELEYKIEEAPTP